MVEGMQTVRTITICLLFSLSSGMTSKSGLSSKLGDEKFDSRQRRPVNPLANWLCIDIALRSNLSLFPWFWMRYRGAGVGGGGRGSFLVSFWEIRAKFFGRLPIL